MPPGSSAPLHYSVHGRGAPLLLIHGLGSSGNDWAPQIPAFAAHHRVIAPDLRGHGRSPSPAAPWSMHAFADDLLALLDDLGIGSAHVLGLSLGGGIAFQLAVQAPHRVRSLVIVNSGPELLPRTLGEHLAIWKRYAIIHLLGMRRMGAALAPRLFPEAPELQRRFVERFATNDKRAYLAALRAFVGWSVTRQLGAIRCPALVVAADQDYTPVAAKQAYVGLMPAAQLAVVADSRHALPMEKPAAFNACVLPFLRSVA
ncbi:MAG: alpha/beta fold hydrolase [Sinimarinibacterium flocculans]|uniref:alpha/beta fold hydrolase n=1 Tax=Sinimarinibacterium flocculans TaxID=985250 RepID=UPI003C63BA86